MAEPTGWHFWLTWIAEAGTAIGTIGAVVVAIFGDRLRGLLGAPQLEISLVDPNGSYSRFSDGKSIDTSSRWYHLRVENKRRHWTTASDVRLLLLKFEQRNAAGQFRPTWAGEIPLQWAYQQITSLTPAIGPARDCDLCNIIKGQADQISTRLSLNPLMQPLSLPTSWQSRVEFALTVQARSLESDSNLFRVVISWDGQWSDDTIEMANHLVVKPANNV